MKKYLFLPFLLLLFQCENGPQENNTDSAPETNITDTTDLENDTDAQEKMPAPPPASFSYKLDKPDQSFKLPNELKEISGLSLSSDGQYLLAVNDEQGRVYYINKQSGEIEKDVLFEGAGDYEGVEMVGDKIYAAKSNGHIYEIKNLDKKKPDIKTFKTDLGGSNDVEGLGYDAASNHLLLACKGKAGKGEDFKNKRAVYAFDLNKEVLEPAPFLLIDRNEIQKWAEDGKAGGLTNSLVEFFEPGLAEDAFAPSAIAVHPKTGEVYILSSIGKILVVVNKNSKILHLLPLDPDLYKQPEGICFDKDGTMFISNEGKGGKGKVYRFSMN